MELDNSDNWNVDNWITGNRDDGFKYNGCAAFQKILDGKCPLCMFHSETNLGFQIQKFLSNTTLGSSISKKMRKKG